MTSERHHYVSRMGFAVGGVPLRRLVCLLLSWAVLGTIADRVAADLWWDTNGATAGASGDSTPGGDWGGVNWTTNSAGTSATQSWVPGEIAVFSAGTNGTGAYSVVFTNNVNVAGIRLEEGSPLLNSNASTGVLNFTNGALLVDVAANRTLNASAYFGPTNGVVTKTGPGRFFLQRDQTSFAGKWIVNEGILQFSGFSNTNLGVAPASVVPDRVSVNNGAGVFGTTDEKTGLTLGPGGGGFLYLDQFSTGSMYWGGPITGSSGGPFTIEAHAIVGIGNPNNNYDGETILKDGIVRLWANEVIPDTSPVKIVGASTLALQGFDETVTSLSGIASSRIELNVGGSPAFHKSVLTIQNPGGETIASQISGGGKLAKNGTGTLIVTGNNGSYEFVLNSGTVGVGHDNAFGSGGLLRINGGTLANTASANRAIASEVAINGNFLVDDSMNASAGAFRFLGPTTVNASHSITVNSNSKLEILDLRQSTSGHALTKIGPGTLELLGADQNLSTRFAGAIHIVEGRLQVTASSIVGTGNNPLNLAGGTLNTTGSRILLSQSLHPISVTTDSAITTTSTDSVVYISFGHNSFSGSGKLTFRNDAPSGSGEFRPQLAGGGASFTPGPIEVANGQFGTTALYSVGHLQTLPNVISGNGSFVRAANGAIATLSAANTYSGGTTITGGTLLVNNTSGSGTGSGSVLIGAVGTLGGTGTISGTVANNGKIAPGTSIGTLTVNNDMSFGANSRLAIEVSGTSADLLAVAGNLDLSAGDFLDVTGTGSGPWVVATYGATLNGSFENVTNGYILDYTTPGQIVLNTIALAGDYNGDGFVDAVDYTLWRKKPAAYSGAAGYNSWRANFGRTLAAGGGAVNAAVPEPTATLLIIGSAGVCLSLRPKKGQIPNWDQ